jgi:hypothetical protein
MKRLLFMLLTIMLSLFLVACAASGTTSGSNSGTDSETSTEVVKLTWPKDKLGSVPQLKGITITDITDAENGVSIAFEGCDSNKTKMYIEQLKRADWEFKTLNTEEGKFVTCDKPGEHMVFFSAESGAGTIVYSAD